MHPPRFLLLACLLLVLAACGGGKKADPTTVPTAQPNTATARTAIDEANGSTATDGICQVVIPDDWTDDGSGRGLTTTNDHWMIFGGSVATDSSWTSAKDLVKTEVGGADATVSETDTSITVLQPNGQGFLTRVRFENRYCEFSVISAGDRTDDVVAVWQSVASSMHPVSKQT
jgi:hypothetical protein